MRLRTANRPARPPNIKDSERVDAAINHKLAGKNAGMTFSVRRPVSLPEAVIRPILRPGWPELIEIRRSKR